MDIQAILALVVATAVLGLVPGPIVAALVGRALFGGVKSTFGFLAGVFVGDLAWLLAAVSGLGYMAATYSTAFLVIKYVGAAYLIYIGIQAIRHAMDKKQEIKIPKSARKGAGFISGLLVTLGNPKLVAFYVGFLPTFIDMQALKFSETLLAAILVPSTFALLNFGWAVCAAKAKTLFKSATPLRVLNYISGGLLVGAGAVMMAED
ncbi:LysE family translocator [Terasakiella sp. A23]|uniref:LysE family translocator n=1 Tax=Terasakiella sp. FCG-A23 TaxID=3080561 RepID=UPI002954CE6B|nr:LysE family translocator [Terasakiella sp. A23]MDV7341414.1 LysE family translocator [Terasakiella sp. A23]